MRTSFDSSLICVYSSWNAGTLRLFDLINDECLLQRKDKMLMESPMIGIYDVRHFPVHNKAQS